MIYFSSDNQIAYFHAPKNGSRTMLGYLALTREANLFEEHPEYFHPTDDEVYSPLRERVQRSNKHHYNPNEVPIVDNPIRLVIKRDPVKRFVSGYRNRVLHHKRTKTQPSFDKFVEDFDYYYNSEPDIQTHFRPQVYFFGLSKENYTHVFDTSEMSLVKELFEDTYSRSFPNLRLQQGGNHVSINVSTEQEKKIRRLYEQDYSAGWC